MGIEMRERKDPKFIQFSDGEAICGVLTAIQAIELKDKTTGQTRKATRFVVAEGEIEEDQWCPSGEMVCFLGTYQLNSALQMSDRGHFVSIRCEGNDPQVTKNGNPMKRFKVWVSQDVIVASGPAQVESLEITDADIPF